MERIAGTPWEIAVRLRRTARERLGLPVTVGIARTKHLAKIASAVAKPDGLLLVPPGDELAFLHPLPVERIWGIGPATAARLRRIGVATAGELARVPGGRPRDRSWVPPRHATSTRSPTTTTPAPSAGAPAAARSAPSTRSA